MHTIHDDNATTWRDLADQLMGVGSRPGLLSAIFKRSVRSNEGPFRRGVETEKS